MDKPHLYCAHTELYLGRKNRKMCSFSSVVLSEGCRISYEREIVLHPSTAHVELRDVLTCPCEMLRGYKSYPRKGTAWSSRNPIVMGVATNETHSCPLFFRYFSSNYSSRVAVSVVATATRNVACIFPVPTCWRKFPHIRRIYPNDDCSPDNSAELWPWTTTVMRLRVWSSILVAQLCLDYPRKMVMSFHRCTLDMDL